MQIGQGESLVQFFIERKPPAVPVVPKSFSYTDKKYPPLVEQWRSANCYKNQRRKLCEYKGTEIIEERRTKIMFTYWKVSRPSTAFHRLWGVERGKIV